MQYDVSKINPQYHFFVDGVSYIGKPKSGTVMYVSKKVEQLVKNLSSMNSCLIFAENNVLVPDELKKDNCFVYTDNPQLEYAQFLSIFEKEKNIEDAKKKYTLVDGGYYLGENVSIGEHSYIEPGCLIGHDVIIGDRARILCGSVIKHAVIGNDFLCNENAVIGANGFTIAEDAQGNRIRIPTLGNIVIGNEVEIGAHDSISRGSAGTTVIDNYVKIDALVYIGHDVHICRNAEITAGCIFGGFDEIGEHCFTGMNSSMRNRIQIGDNSVIGMGAVVTKSICTQSTVVGNPAKNMKES